ncbi:hypothetical protein WSM22_13780 [Cytophagales bacterium WSM2-2]|nr:hypothetical protein WSM22_13780 [Cytophagales bacterium WSM2-2]
MEIVVIGSDLNLNECREKFGTAHHYQLAGDDIKSYLAPGVFVFDFTVSDVSVYQNQNDVVVFLNTAFKTLTQLTTGQGLKANVFGFCGLPTFLNREILEVCVPEGQLISLEKACLLLETKFRTVEDRMGMITPRIICMIINEAYFTIEEGVASRDDIDQAMRLGTNYPFGPFEWCDKIGIRNVYELLKAVFEGTGDERYRISKLLEKEANA